MRPRLRQPICPGPVLWRKVSAAAGADRVAGDRGGGGVDDEEEAAVVADLDPAGCAAVVGDRGSDRGQGAVGGVEEAGDEAWEGGASGCGVGVGDEQLIRARRAELCAELAPALRGREGRCEVGRAGAGVSRPPWPTVKLSISDVAMRVPASLVPSRLKSTCPGLRVVREHVGRVGNRAQMAASVEPEAGVVRVAGAAAGARVRDVHEVAVDSDAHRVDAVRGDRGARRRPAASRRG